MELGLPMETESASTSTPVMALLFILDLLSSLYTLRPSEMRKLISFVFGISTWQFIVIVTASSIGEEFIYCTCPMVKVKSHGYNLESPLNIYFSLAGYGSSVSLNLEFNCFSLHYRVIILNPHNLSFKFGCLTMFHIDDSCVLIVKFYKLYTLG